MEHEPKRTDRRNDDRVDEIIRRRFHRCESMPLFPERRPDHRTERHGFFELPPIGPQLPMFDARATAAR